MIGCGDTVGVFQIESRAQMAMLPRLRPQSLYDLVIEVSIVRPGPIAGGMVHPYLQRRTGAEPVAYPHPSLVPVLEKTLGVPLFQEQVMKLAIVAADYTPGEADQLRRDMAAWRRSGRIEQHRERLVTRMIAKGIPPAFAEQVFQQIRGFGEYGFPESHAASFALISYAAAYLKCHYPAEFTCALLNAQPMGFYSIATIVEDAKRHHVAIVPIDVCHSQWPCTLEPLGEHTWAVRMGLRFVKGLGEKEGGTISTAREAGIYHSLADFVRRTRLEGEVVSVLAEAGALVSLEGSRRAAWWEGRGLVRRHGETLALPSRDTTPTFAPLTPDEVITWDYRTTRHSPRGHPLQPLRPLLQAHGLPDARRVGELPAGDLVRFVGVVITRQRPGAAKGVVFLTLEDETGFINVVLWPPVLRRYAVLAKTARLLGVTGRLQVQAEVVHLIARQLWIPRLPQTPTTNASRDFR
jgi:error-prone DNA polymerase